MREDDTAWQAPFMLCPIHIQILLTLLKLTIKSSPSLETEVAHNFFHLPVPTNSTARRQAVSVTAS